MTKQLIFKDDLNSIFSVNKYLQIENKCREILKDDTIRFVGIINNMGKLVAGGCTKGVDPIETNEKRTMLYMQMTLGVSMCKEFDDNLGKTNYIATNRNKILTITIPTNDHLILISAKPTATAEQIITKANIQELIQSEI